MAIYLMGSLITCSEGVRRFKAGLDLDLVATKWLTASNNGCFGAFFALKTSCRGGAIPSYYISSWYLFQRLVLFAS
jgi:hypothetical protein